MGRGTAPGASQLPRVWPSDWDPTGLQWAVGWGRSLVGLTPQRASDPARLTQSQAAKGCKNAPRCGGWVIPILTPTWGFHCYRGGALSHRPESHPGPAFTPHPLPLPPPHCLSQGPSSVCHPGEWGPFPVIPLALSGNLGLLTTLSKSSSILSQHCPPLGLSDTSGLAAGSSGSSPTPPCASQDSTFSPSPHPPPRRHEDTWSRLLFDSQGSESSSPSICSECPWAPFRNEVPPCGRYEPRAQACARLPGFHSRLWHFEASSVPQSPVCETGITQSLSCRLL